MQISVFGLGYVGAVSAGCLAREGHYVVGVDPEQRKVDLINSGNTPVIEKDIGGIIQMAVDTGRLHAISDAYQAVASTELSLVCVGTPSQPNGSIDLRYVRAVCMEIGEALSKKSEFHVVVMRSTMLPGSMRDTVIPLLEKYSGKAAGRDFGVCNNPEFLREGTAVYDYFHPPKTVIGEYDSVSGDLLAEIYRDVDAPLVRTDIETAEMVKYTDNVWHAVKVSFANEIGSICKELEIDGRKVMEIFCQDEKLNLSSYYLKPGFAFGGSCLPKDVRALQYRARMLDLDLPLLESVMRSNQCHIERGIKMVLQSGHKKVGVLGFSFKAGTDDLRESPVVELIERLIGKGLDIMIYDDNVKLAALMGANREYILNQIPHISRLMVDSMDEILKEAETIVIGNADPRFQDVAMRISKHQVLVDLTGIVEEAGEGATLYEGICW